MAELTLCMGTLAKTPYYITGLGVNVYSIEELCYCLAGNAYILDEDLMDPKLCTFIEKQLQLKELATDLRELIDENKSIGEFVTTILTKTGYLSEEEIYEVKQVLLDNAMLGFANKRKARGDNLLKNRKYMLAIDEYQYILENIDKAEETELYAAILHNIGTAYAYMFLFEKAAYYYREAADLADGEESRIAYLMATRMTMHKDQYDKLLLRHGYDAEFLAKVDKRMEQGRFGAEHSPYREAMDNIKELKGSGRINDYYKAIDDTLSSWKQEYRRNMNA
ncbi:MAG: hypothetical protein J5518_00710 [Lachnospiraceae bacterium]|nr:hypothetical protein [Lachnospiraceae bacterium]